jgi:hypothetical protein
MVEWSCIAVKSCFFRRHKHVTIVGNNSYFQARFCCSVCCSRSTSPKVFLPLSSTLLSRLTRYDMFGLRTALPGARSLGKFSLPEAFNCHSLRQNNWTDNDRGSKGPPPTFSIGARNLIRPTKKIQQTGVIQGTENTPHHGSPLISAY